MVNKKNPENKARSCLTVFLLMATLQKETIFKT